MYDPGYTRDTRIIALETLIYSVPKNTLLWAGLSTSENPKSTQAIVGDEVSVILLSAPGAMSYYPAVGFQQAGNAFLISRKR